jgi:hypothetical protein
MSHTPGPWIWGECHEGLYGRGEIKKSNAVLDFYPYEGMGVYPTNAEANARLIAAAPDLLAVARTVSSRLQIEIDEFDGAPVHFKQMKALLDAAIAKAEGK